VCEGKVDARGEGGLLQRRVRRCDCGWPRLAFARRGGGGGGGERGGDGGGVVTSPPTRVCAREMVVWVKGGSGGVREGDDGVGGCVSGRWVWLRAVCAREVVVWVVVVYLEGLAPRCSSVCGVNGR